MNGKKDISMNQFLKLSLSLSCCAVLLAGCGSSGTPTAGSASSAAESAPQAQTVPQVTPEEIRAANSIPSLLERHSTVTITTEQLDADGNLMSTTETQYTRGPAGLLMTTKFTGSDLELTESGVPASGNMAGYIAEGMPGALYTESNGEKSLQLFRSSEYEERLSSLWLPSNEEAGAVEELVECAEQDGALVITSNLTYEDFDDYTNTNLYYVDPESLDMLYMEVTAIDKDGVTTAIGQYRLEYDQPYAEKNDLVSRTVDTDDACALTLLINPDQKDEEIQQLRVAKDCEVYFYSSQDYSLYSDEACTQEIYFIDVTGETATAYAVLKA
jgi:hypothetical protein